MLIDTLAVVLEKKPKTMHLLSPSVIDAAVVLDPAVESVPTLSYSPRRITAATSLMFVAESAVIVVDPSVPSEVLVAINRPVLVSRVSHPAGGVSVLAVDPAQPKIINKSPEILLDGTVTARLVCVVVVAAVAVAIDHGRNGVVSCFERTLRSPHKRAINRRAYFPKLDDGVPANR